MLEKANGKNNWHYNPKLKKYGSENSELVRIDISIISNGNLEIRNQLRNIYKYTSLLIIAA